MKYFNKDLTIISLKRGNNSYYGNPSYFVGLADKDNNIYYAKTASNSSLGYSISNYKINDTLNFKYHFTKAGNMILNSINK